VGAPGQTEKQADLVLLDRNPPDGISATQPVYTVILRAMVGDRTALDRRQREVRAKVSGWNAEAAK
jgi:hypothetical protein